MEFLKNKESWQKAFLRLPVLLTSTSVKSFVMQNGVDGDFCISYDKEIKDFCSTAWSTNTRNFIKVENDKVLLYNWLRKAPEKISLNAISENINGFNKYLHSLNKNEYENVIQFVLRIFREMRNELNDNNSGEQTLKNLFHIISDGKFTSYDIRSEIAEKYSAKYTNGISEIHNLKPETELIIRHASSQLFYEAHSEIIYFDKQMDLWGNASTQSIANTRSYSSVHYTPTYVARSIVENVVKELDLSKPKLKIFDPACGSSEFLCEVLKQLHTLNFKGEIEIIGWDKSSIAELTSTFVLDYFKKEWGNKLKIEIKQVENSLTEKWDSDYDLILMNPPFISWELLNDDTSRDAVKTALGEYYEGKPNLASAFFIKAINSLNTTGVIGCIIPSSILNFEAYKKMRTHISQILDIKILGKLGNYIFSNALTDVSLFIGTKNKQKELPILMWTNNEKEIAKEALTALRKYQYEHLYTIDENQFSIYRSKLNAEFYNINSFSTNKTFIQLETTTNNNLIKISELFDVNQGIRTGNNDVFKISQKYYQTLPAKEKKYFRYCVDNSSIINGKLTLTDYVWFPYGNEGLNIKTETELKQTVPEFYKYLINHKEPLSKRAGVIKWWDLTRPRNWQFGKFPKLISTEFGKAGSFAFDIKGNAVVERGNGWNVKSSIEDEDFYSFYLAIFNSDFFNTLLLIYCKQLAGGSWFDLGKKYTQQIPIPNFDELDKEKSEIKRLIQIGKNMHDGVDINKQELIDLVKFKIYKISD